MTEGFSSLLGICWSIHSPPAIPENKRQRFSHDAQNDQVLDCLWPTHFSVHRIRRRKPLEHKVPCAVFWAITQTAIE